jgi:hypothetical protein
LLEDRRLLTAGIYFEDFTHDSDRILNPPPGHQFRPAWDTFDTDPATMPGGDADSDPNTSLGPDELLIRNDFPWPSNVTSGPTHPMQDGGYAAIIPNANGPVGPNILSVGIAQEGGIGRMVFDFPAPGTPGGFAPDEEIATATLDFRGIGEVTFVGANTSLVMTVDTRDPAFGQRLWQQISVGRDSLAQHGHQLMELGAIQQIIVRSTRGLDINRIGVLVFPKSTPQTNVIANDDFAVVSQRQRFPGVHIDWRRNDIALDNSLLTLVSHTQPLFGTIEMHNASGTGNYEPLPGFLGRDSFEYVLRDAQGNTDRANVILDVVNNLPPVVLGQQFTALHAGPSPFRGALNFNDPDGDAGIDPQLGPAPGETTVTFPRQGQVTNLRVNGDRIEFDYEPHAGVMLFNDRFYITVSDGMGGVSEPALVEIIVPNTAPQAGNLTLSTGQESHDNIREPIRGFLPISDADGDALQVVLVDPPQHGVFTLIDASTGLFEYQLLGGDATVDGFATDRFIYKVIDVVGAHSNIATVVVVGWPNNVPLARGEFYQAVIEADENDSCGFNARAYVVADDLGVTRNENQPPVIPGVLENDIDLDGDRLEVRVVVPPAYGTLRFTEGVGDTSVRGGFTYEVFPDTPIFYGAYDVFAYEVSDGWSVSNLAAATIYIPYSACASSDDPRVQLLATPDAYEVPSGTLARLRDVLPTDLVPRDVLREPLWNDVDMEGNSLRASVSNPKLFIEPVSDSVGTLSVDASGAVTYFTEQGTNNSHPSGDPDIRVYHVEYKDVIGDRLASFVTNKAELNFRVSPDLDHVSDSVEDGAPHGGDGNSDGILDRVQANVTSFPNVINGAYVTLVSSPGTWLEPVNALDDLGEWATPVDLPLGAIAFAVKQWPFGTEPTVTLILPANTRIDTYYKFGGKFVDESTCVEDPIVVNGTDVCVYEFLFDGSTGAQFFATGGQEVTPHTNAIVDRIVLHFVDEGRGDDPFPVGNIFIGEIHDPGGPAIARAAPRVQNIQINDGASQRSMVNSLTVTFDGLVALESDAFQVYQQGVAAPMGVHVALSESLGRTVARLTFQGPGIIGGSLADGQYQLVVRGDKIRGAGGGLLDGDGDGLAGGNHVDEFFRLFGDSDGDGDVDTVDAAAFKPSFRKRIGDAGYLWYFDHDASGRIGAEDFALLLLGYRQSNPQ